MFVSPVTEGHFHFFGVLAESSTVCFQCFPLSFISLCLIQVIAVYILKNSCLGETFTRIDVHIFELRLIEKSCQHLNYFCLMGNILTNEMQK